MRKISFKKSLSRKISITLPLLIFSLVFLCVGFADAADKAHSTNKAFIVKKKSRQSKVVSRLKVKSAWKKNIGSKTPWGKIKSIGSPDASSRPTIYKDTLYIGSKKKVFYAFDSGSGALRWKFKAASPIDADAGVDGNMACFGTTAGVLHCLDSATGKELWNYNTRSEIISAPLITKRYVYFTSAEDKVYALERDSGKKIWSYTGIAAHYVLPRIITSPVISSSKKKLFVLLANGSLLSLDTKNGKELWNKKVITSKINSVERARRRLVASGKELLMIDERGVVVVHNQTDGKKLASYPVIKTIDFILNQDNIYLLGEELLVGVRLKDSKVIWSTSLNHGNPSLMAKAENHLIVIFSKTEIPYDIKYLKRVNGYACAYTMSSGDESFKEKFRLPLVNIEINEKTLAMVNSKGALRVFSME